MQGDYYTVEVEEVYYGEQPTTRGSYDYHTLEAALHQYELLVSRYRRVLTRQYPYCVFNEYSDVTKCDGKVTSCTTKYSMFDDDEVKQVTTQTIWLFPHYAALE